jgi:hypothetical protein
MKETQAEDMRRAPPELDLPRDHRLNRDNPVAVGSDIGVELWDRSWRRLPPPASADEPK